MAKVPILKFSLVAIVSSLFFVASACIIRGALGSKVLPLPQDNDRALIHSQPNLISSYPFLSLPLSDFPSYLYRYVRRCNAAHQNSWEAMMMWVSAVCVAKIVGVEERTMNTLATRFLAARVA